MVPASLRLQQAFQLHQAGRLAEAQQLYSQILAAEPNNAEALHLFGVLLHQAGQHAPAEALLRRAVALAPAAFVPLDSLGNVRLALARPVEAEQAFRAALRLQPNLPELHHHLGMALRDQKNLPEAEGAWRQALKLRKDFAAVRLDLGNLLVEAGRAAEAETCVAAALRTEPENPKLLNTLGLALAAQGKHAAALEAFDRARALDPASLSPLANRATALAELERFSEAADAYGAALALAPDAEDLQLGLARVLLRLKRAPALEALLRGMLARRPNDAELLQSLGKALALQDRMAEALTYLQAALAADPTLARAWHGLGTALGDLARWDEAQAALAEAVRLAPAEPEYRLALAGGLLLRGDYAAFWPAFEARLELPNAPRLAAPRWDGAPTARTVLLTGEQGMGDVIQFVRFVRQAAARAPVVLAAPTALRPLLEIFSDVATVVTEMPVPPHDLHCPLMSLPLVLGIGPADFGSTVPYLRADPARVAAWRDRLAPLPGKRVGLVWAGNPEYGADRHRSIPFACLAPLLAPLLPPLLDVPPLSFVSLQMGAARADLPACAAFDAAPWIGDYADTAALIMALDLVIAVDTSVAHLAGALGAPIWMLNRANTDPRWLLDRDDTPWYPSMRIFRQPTPGDWPSVITNVAAALRA